MVMLMVLWNSLALADWDPARASMANATQRMRQTQNSSQNCPPANRCNNLQFLQSLETRDYESRFFGALKSRAPACQVAVDKTKNPQLVNRFANAQDLAKHFASRFPEIGAVNHQRIASCAASNDASSRYKTAKFYSYMTRLNAGATRAYEEIAAINQLLGTKENFKCEGKGVLDGAYRRCEELNNLCRQGASLLDATAAQSEQDEKKYLAAKADLVAAQKCTLLAGEYKKNASQLSATNQKIERCEQVFVERQAPKKICTTYTWEHQQKMSQCQKAIGDLQITMVGLESNNPWFRSENYFEFRKTKSVKDSIRLQVQTNKRELQKKILEFRNAGLCTNGFLSSQACDGDKVRAVIAATPEIQNFYGKDQRGNVGNLYLEAQSCIEEGVRDQNETAKVLNGAARDAVLTIATAGLSGVAMGAKAAWTLRGAGALTAAVAVGGVNAFYFKQSYSEAQKACAPQEQKLNIASMASLGKECPGPKSQVSQAQREHANCMVARGFAALDALPFVPLSTAVRAASRLAKTARGGSDVAQIARQMPEVKPTPSVRETPNVSLRPASEARAARMESQGTRRMVVRDYARKQFTTADQNADWVKLGSRTEPDGKTVFLDVQNSSMKRLNDATSDKDLVSALTNKNIEIVTQKVDGLLSEFPTVQAVPYSDFKGIRYAFQPKPPAKALPKDFHDRLKAVLEEGNKEFAEFAKRSKAVSGSEDPSKWFSYGYGHTGDQANMAARYAKGQTSANSLQDFTNERVQASMSASLRRAEDLRTGLNRELAGTPLVDSSAGRSSLSSEVFEISRKSESAADLQTQLSRTMGVDVSPSQAERILNYSRTVDEFSPSISVVQRQSASLTEATHGGISIDFKGVGGQNLKETAEALAGADGLSSSISGARLNEASITRDLRTRESQVRQAVDEVARANNLKVQIRVSGDDMVIIPDRAMTTAEKEQIAQAVTRRVDPAKIRMSTIPDGVPKAQRAELAATGENIEKQLRSNLQGQIPKEKLDKLLFSVDMQPKNSATVANLRTTSRNVNLTDAERRKIDEAFERALTKLGPHASPAEMHRNASLSPKEKVEAFEDINNLPRGYASKRPNLVDEVERIENQYQTPVSNKPAIQRPRAEREALVAKRQELRKLGFTDQQIRRGMNQGIFGSNLPKQNQSLASAKVKKRYEGEAAESAGFGGGQSDGIEILETSDGDTFAKILPYKISDLGTPGSIPERYHRLFKAEAEFGELLSQQGIGPKFKGTYVGADGRPRVAYEFIDGTDVRAGDDAIEGIERLPDSIIPQMREINRKLVNQGINPLDIQYRVDKNGRVYVIDTANFERLPPALIKQTLKQLDEEVDQIADIQRKAKAALREKERAIHVESKMSDADLAKIPPEALPKMKQANQRLADKGINPEHAEYDIGPGGEVSVANAGSLKPLQAHQKNNAVNEADLDVDAIAELKGLPRPHTLTHSNQYRPNKLTAPEFSSGVPPKSDPKIVEAFHKRFGSEKGTFYRGIRVPKGAQMDSHYVRSDGLGSMVSTNARDAIHYGKSPAGLKAQKLNPDDDVILLSYELKPYHIQEDTYGTLEHVFMNPDINLKSANIKYKAIRVPASALNDPKKVEQYLQQLRGQ